MTGTSNTGKTLRRTIARLLVGSALLAGLTGCRPEQDPFLDLVDAQLGTRQLNDLDKTMGLAASDTSYDYRQYEDKITGGLNRWINRVVEDGGEAADDSRQWQPSSDVRELVASYQDVPAAAAFDQRQFVATDPYFIRGRSWMKSIARRVCESPHAAPVELLRLQAGNAAIPEGEKSPARWLIRQVHPELASDDADRLGDALLLFDWTVRNFQLEEPFRIDASAVTDFQLTDDGSSDLPRLGIPGLGYRRLPWQILVFARVDYVERARLFAGLCQQRGIETALLNCGGRPWSVAALIGGQAWLFDPRLGLPIPGEKPGQIATLSWLKENPDRLKPLSLTVAESNREDAVYWVQPDQLADLRAEVFVSPESVSRRMAFLENRLIGDRRLTLTDRPERTIELLASAATGVPATLSRFEFDAHRFRRVVGEAIQRSSVDPVIADRLGWYWQDEAYIDRFVDYRSARNLFFIGRFEVERNSRKMSAVAGFYSLMYPDDLIANIAEDVPRLNRLGVIRQKGQSAAEFQRELEGLQQNMRLVRRDVGVFLAQSHFDNGNVSSCGNWMDRLQQRDDTERWISILRYMEGRSLEAIRDYGPAVEHFARADGAQFLGNMLRARFLTEAVTAAGLKLAPPEPEQPAASAPEPEASGETGQPAGDAPAAPPDDASPEPSTDDPARQDGQAEKPAGENAPEPRVPDGGDSGVGGDGTAD